MHCGIEGEPLLLVIANNFFVPAEPIFIPWVNVTPLRVLGMEELTARSSQLI